MQTTRRDFVLLAVGLGLWLTFLLGQRGLNEPDEGRYANIALGFFKPASHWWEPRMSDLGHYDKPPLTYWLTALAFKVFGTNEWAARLTPLLGAVMALAGLGWAAWRLYGRETAWWALLICGTLGQFWLLARFLTPDMLLTGGCTLAIAAWAEARHRQGHWGFWGLGVWFWTVAWWTKATPALIPLAGLTAGLWLVGDKPGRQALRPALTLGCVLLLGSPWYLWMMATFPDLTDFFFGRELAGRVLGHADGRRGPIYYHVALIFLQWLPWLPVLGALFVLNRRHFPPFGWQTWRRAIGVEGWMVVVGLLILCCISSKLPTYTLPLAPWAALLLARALLKLKGVMAERDFKRLTFATTGGILTLLTVAALLAPRFEIRLRVNSSVRPVSQELHRRGAQVVFMDRYWPGMEVYFGDKVHYVVGSGPRQRRDDSGLCPALGNTHFCQPEHWLERLSRTREPNVWLVHYVRNRNSPFLATVETKAYLDQVRLGDFWLIRVK